MFGRRKHTKSTGVDGFGSDQEYKDRRHQLFETPVYVPRHQPIELPGPDDAFGRWADLEAHRWAFDYFRGFPDYIHQFHCPGDTYDIGPWRLEQRSDPFAVMTGVDDSPILGLRYRLHYNSCRIGAVEIVPDSLMSELPEPYKEVSLHIQIDDAPLLPYDHVMGLCSLCCNRLDQNEELRSRRSKQQLIAQAIMAVMWEAMREDSVWQSLAFDFPGAVNITRGFPLEAEND